MDTGPQRRVEFAGATNFRDLGGYETAAGRTRWGLVYRADGMQQLTESDLRRYDALGIRVVYDLRRNVERETLPSRVPSLALCIMSPVEEAGVEPLDRTALTDERSGHLLLRRMYEGMLAHSGPVVGRIFGGLAGDDGLPAVFHCHGGKDRTGLVAALLLEALGVPREVVLDDYELTAQYRLVEHQEGTYDRLVESGMAAEAAAGVLGAPRWAMAETLADLDAEYGGIETYLLERAGLDRAVIGRLRELLVED